MGNRIGYIKEVGYETEQDQQMPWEMKCVLKEIFTKELVKGRTHRGIRRQQGLSLEQYNHIMDIKPE